MSIKKQTLKEYLETKNRGPKDKSDKHSDLYTDEDPRVQYTSIFTDKKNKTISK